jgi:hypothetical protein
MSHLIIDCALDTACARERMRQSEGQAALDDHHPTA